MPHVKKVHCRPKKVKKNLVHTSLKKTTSILQFTLVIKKQKRIRESPSLSKRAMSFMMNKKKRILENNWITQVTRNLKISVINS